MLHWRAGGSGVPQITAPLSRAPQAHLAHASVKRLDAEGSGATQVRHGTARSVRLMVRRKSTALLFH